MLDFYDDIMEMILDYLPVKDLLNASLVSKEWLEYIGKSAVFRKKVMINSYFYSNPLISSIRTYESLNIRQHEMNSTILKLIKDYEWRTVFFTVKNILSQKHFTEIIQNMQHVRDLKIMNLNITKLNDHKKLSLPKLEKLFLKDVAVDTFDTFLSNHPVLKTLSLRYVSDSILNKRTVREYVIEFLTLNSQVRQLDLYTDVINELFKSEVTQIMSLKLKSISLHLCDEENAVIWRNIEDFLKSHENSLEELNFFFRKRLIEIRKYEYSVYKSYMEDENAAAEEERDEKCNDISILFNVWNNLSSLKKLTLRFFVNFVENHEFLLSFKNLRPNNSIKILNIKHIGCTIPVKTVEKIIQLCPNLNSLYISNLNPSVINFCSQNLRLLKSIKYSVEENDAIKVYDTTIKLANDDCNKLIMFYEGDSSDEIF